MTELTPVLPEDLQSAHEPASGTRTPDVIPFDGPWKLSTSQAGDGFPVGPGRAPTELPLSQKPHLGAGIGAAADKHGVIGVDDRRRLRDRSFPWTTIGRFMDFGSGHIDVAGVGGTGVMVGPRHVLTASHCIPWRGTPQGGYVFDGAHNEFSFVPAFDNEHPQGVKVPFGVFKVKKVIAVYPLPNFGKPPPLIGNPDPSAGYVRPLDLAVCVLHDPVGLRTGWMGFHHFVPDWIGKPWWHTAGYPDLGNPAYPYPTFQGAETGARLTDMDDKTVFEMPNGLKIANAMRLSHTFDTWSGQSGSPIFGWFQGEAAPRVIAVINGRNDGGQPNHAAAGGCLAQMVAFAREMHPD